jgi:hypothetical protein
VPLRQVPLEQLSEVVHALPSEQGDPSGDAGFEQAPVAMLHVPASWQPSCGTQITGLPPAHVPALQASDCVQALLSSHGVPSGRAGFEQTPFAGLQAPALWQASEGAHTTGVVPTHTPPEQESVSVQAFKSLQAVPFGAPPHGPGVTVVADTADGSPGLKSPIVTADDPGATLASNRKL